MKAPWKTLLFLFALLQPAAGQNAADAHPYPEAAAFAGKITDVVWKLRGTHSLKGLRFDGKAMWPVRDDGVKPRPYETVVPDVGVVRIAYPDDTSSWNFFSDDLRFVCSVKIRSERTFAIPAGATAKPVVRFPQDIEGVVFASTDDGPDRIPAKIRWDGKELEFAGQRGGAWKTERQKPFVANRRVFETRASAEVVVWFVFGADGKEAWFLQVENIFGGHRANLPAKSAVTKEVSGLSEAHNDLANHMLDLMAAGVKEPVWTLQRQFERKLAKNPAVLERLKKRVDGK